MILGSERHSVILAVTLDALKLMPACGLKPRINCQKFRAQDCWQQSEHGTGKGDTELYNPPVGPPKGYKFMAAPALPQNAPHRQPCQLSPSLTRAPEPGWL